MLVGVLLLGALPAAASPGDRDSTFSGDGLAPTFTNRYYAPLGPMTDGGVVVGLFRDSDAGINGEDRGSAPFRLLRYGPSGAPVTFAENAVGDLWQFSPTGLSYPSLVAEASPTSIVVVGGHQSGTTGRLGVMRVDGDGDYDPTFTGDGRATYKVFTRRYPVVDAFRAVPLDGGKVGIAAYAGSYDSSGRFTLKEQALVRLTATGDLDPTFSGDGIRPLVLADSDVTFLPDGSSYFGRKVGTRHEVRHLSPSGAIDYGFDGGSASVACGDHRGALLRAGADGLPRLACVRIGPPVHGVATVEMVLYRFTTAGALDPTYGTAGKNKVTMDYGDAGAVWDFDALGRLWVVTTDRSRRVVTTWRIDADGHHDTPFGDDSTASTLLPWDVYPFSFGVGPTRAFIALQRSAATSVVMAIEA